MKEIGDQDNASNFFAGKSTMGAAQFYEGGDCNRHKKNGSQRVCQIQRSLGRKYLSLFGNHAAACTSLVYMTTTMILFTFLSW
mmetsp:Transcript_26888/g.57178  ORF Transcript_26888/g.57178 Transcript_26888/m.57178 type:complete len:83 (-) Transcript_26888:36-284(-)